MLSVLDSTRNGGLAPDWDRVTRAVYQVRQHYRYTYTGPVTDLKQQLVMIPPDRHGDQRLLAYDLDVRGASGDHAMTWEQDAFGNRVCRVVVGSVEHAVDFEATYRVERRAGRPRSPTAPRHPNSGALGEYLRATGLTAPDARLLAVARVLRAGAPSPHARAEAAHTWAARAISYQLGVTGVHTPAAMALHLGRGVCQDYAHILLCLLRLLDVPARYVSGHLLGEGAPHAWVEAFLPDPTAPGGTAIVAYDPTHHRRVGLNYITVAVGRDFADVTPTSGFFSGPAAGKLSWSKHAEVVETESANGRAAGEGAA